MKHIIQLFRSVALSSMVGLSLVSCSDFLEIKPRDIVTEDNFWNEKTDVEQMVTGCYTAMQADGFITRCVLWGEGRSENLQPSTTLQGDDYNLYQIMRENLLPSNPYTSWLSFYYVINKCNTIIKMAPIVSEKDPAYRESDVKATIAEMTALRSLCYFYLIRTFDEVPFYRDAVQQEDEVMAIPASSFDYVLNEIIKDLESVKGDAILHYAKANSSDQLGGTYYSDVNRITRTSINAMLCDMYLWKGDNAKAIECADAVIAQKAADYEEEFGKQTGMSLRSPKLLASAYGTTTAYLYQATQDSPSTVFDEIFGTGNSFESIFELNFGYQGEGSNLAQSTALGRLYGEFKSKDSNNGAGHLRPSTDIIAEANNGEFGGFWVNRYDTRFYNSLQATDNRYTNGMIRKGVAYRFSLLTNTGDNASQIPWLNTSLSSYITTANQNRNWIFYRLTDIMLMKAEALLNQISSDDNSDEATQVKRQVFDIIYLVNMRSVGSPNANNYLRTNQSYATNYDRLRDLLRQERNRELLYEGKRWFDLLRYARKNGNPDIVRRTVASKVSGGGGGSNGFPSMDALFWPYNKDELKVNSHLHQKPIYAKVDDGDDDE